MIRHITPFCDSVKKNCKPLSYGIISAISKSIRKETKFKKSVL